MRNASSATFPSAAFGSIVVKSRKWMTALCNAVDLLAMSWLHRSQSQAGIKPGHTAF